MLTTTEILAIRSATDATSSPLYSAPNIQIIAQLHSDSSQILCTLAFADSNNVIQAANNRSFTLLELEDFETGAEAAFKTLMNAIDQAAKRDLENFTGNDGKTITYTART